MNFTRFWDWVDGRDVDKHIVCIVVLYGTKVLSDWAMAFAQMHADKSGLEISAVIGAVTGPYTLLQGAVIKWYFEARSK